VVGNIVPSDGHVGKRPPLSPLVLETGATLAGTSPASAIERMMPGMIFAWALFLLRSRRAAGAAEILALRVEEER